MNNKNALILLALVIIGSALRFYALDFHSLWNDELNTWEIAQMQSAPEIVDFMTYNEVHPPGYHFLLHYLIRAFGDSIFVLKFMSAFFGALSIIAIYFLGKLLYTEKEGIYSAVLLTVSKFPIYYSQELRPYSMLLFLAILSLYFYIKIYRDFRERKKLSILDLILYLIIAIASCYVHYFGLFFIFLQGVTALAYMIIRKRFSFAIFLIYILTVAAYIPLMPMIPHHIDYGPVYIQPTGFDFPFKYFIVAFGKSVYTSIIPVVLFIFLAYKIIANFKEKSDKRNTGMDSFLIGVIIMPIAILAIKSHISNPVLTYRNMIIALPALYLLFVRGFNQLKLSDNLKNYLIAAYAAFLILNLVFIDKYYSKPQKEQFKEATQYIIDRGEEFKDFVFVGFSYRDKYYDYYAYRLGLNRSIDYNFGLSGDTLKFKNAIDSCNKKYICYFAGHRKPDSLFMNYLNNNYKIIEKKEFIGVEVLFLGDEIE